MNLTRVQWVTTGLILLFSASHLVYATCSRPQIDATDKQMANLPEARRSLGGHAFLRPDNWDRLCRHRLRTAGENSGTPEDLSFYGCVETVENAAMSKL